MTRTIPTLLMGCFLAVFLAVVNVPTHAAYIQYELFATEGCLDPPLLKGIAAGNNVCVPNLGIFRSRQFSCSGIINYQSGSECKEVVLDPPAPAATKTELGRCEAVTEGGSIGTFIRYTCRLGDYITKLQTSDGACAEFPGLVAQTDAVASFFLGDDQCTPEFNLAQLAGTSGASKITPINATSALLGRWLANSCDGIPDDSKAITLGSCVPEEGAVGASLYVLTSSAKALTGSSLIVLGSVLSLMVMF